MAESVEAITKPTILINGSSADDQAVGQSQAAEYSGPVTITMTADADHEIRYTFNGRIPTLNSPLYEGPITVRENGNGFSSDNTFIKAKAFYQGRSSRQTRVWFKIV